ncbi:MAG TPA: hypothetical protein VNQ97_05430, partial [Burkholderiaceae bacterium]|nr:hypothetical protein [Burkholderiaceae bacterium]
MATKTTAETYQGNDRLLFGLIMGVIAFWLFATISNFLLNAVAGTLIVSLQLVQFGGNMTAQSAGI